MFGNSTYKTIVKKITRLNFAAAYVKVVSLSINTTSASHAPVAFELFHRSFLQTAVGVHLQFHHVQREDIIFSVTLSLPLT